MQRSQVFKTCAYHLNSATPPYYLLFILYIYYIIIFLKNQPRRQKVHKLSVYSSSVCCWRLLFTIFYLTILALPILHRVEVLLSKNRRRWDSNPCYLLSTNGLANRPLKPLEYFSICTQVAYWDYLRLVSPLLSPQAHWSM